MAQESQAEFVGHEPCPKCGSSDALARYADGGAHCFNQLCDHHEFSTDGEVTTKPESVGKQTKDSSSLVKGEVQALLKRGITEETCAKWAYHVGKKNGKTVQIANYIKDGKIVAQKLRFADKTFSIVGEGKKNLGLYGQHLWRDGGKKVVVTEGEIDALTVSQLQGNKWPVVSVPNGAQGAKKALGS